MVVGKEVKSALEAIVGSDDVTNEEFIITAYSSDITGTPPQRADLIVLPESKEEVSAILRLATQDKIPVVIRAGATMGSGVSLAPNGIILDLTKMDKILRIDEDSMTVTAQAGCPVYRVIKELRRKGFDLPLRPWFGPGPTFGGWLAAAGAGGRMSRYQDALSWITGVEVVLPTGEIIQTGAASVENCGPFMSSASSPFNLNKVFLSSFGTLAVITEITSAMISIPEATEHACYGFSDPTSWAKAAMTLQRKDAATSIDLEDSDLFNHFLEMEVSYPHILILTNQGYSGEVKCRMEVAAEICEQEGGHLLSPALAEVSWDNNATHSFRSVHFGRYTVAVGLHTLTILPEVYQVIKEVFGKYNINNGWITWVSSPSYAVTFPIAHYDAETQAEDAMRASLEILVQLSKLKNYWPGIIRPEYAKLMRKIKGLLDPSGIMNPGAWDFIVGDLIKVAIMTMGGGDSDE